MNNFNLILNVNVAMLINLKHLNRGNFKYLWSACHSLSFYIAKHYGHDTSFTILCLLQLKKEMQSLH